MQYIDHYIQKYHKMSTLLRNLIVGCHASFFKFLEPTTQQISSTLPCGCPAQTIINGLPAFCLRRAFNTQLPVAFPIRTGSVPLRAERQNLLTIHQTFVNTRFRVHHPALSRVAFQQGFQCRRINYLGR